MGRGRPHALHPTPYTLHLTPYTLHPTALCVIYPLNQIRSNMCLIRMAYEQVIDSRLVGFVDFHSSHPHSGRGAARAGDAQETPTQSVTKYTSIRRLSAKVTSLKSRRRSRGPCTFPRVCLTLTQHSPGCFQHAPGRV